MDAERTRPRSLTERRSRNYPHVVLDSPAVARFDAVVDRAFDTIRGNPAIDRVFYTASELGDFSLLWHLLGMATALRTPPGPWGAIRLSSALGVESVLVNGVLKSAFRRDRPDHDGERPHNLRQPRSSSFPSGHASSAMLAAALLGEGSPAKPAYYALAGVVAASRIHVRIHHASDVFGGIAVGIALGAIARAHSPGIARHAGWRTCSVR